MTNKRGYSRIDAYAPTIENYRRNGNYSRRPKASKGKNAVIALVVVVVFAILGAGGFLYYQSLPIDITINGEEYALPGGTTVEEIIAKGIATPAPGNLLAVDGSVLEKGGGAAFAVTRNGVAFDAYKERLGNRDVIVFIDGSDEEEPSDITTAEIPSETVVEGVGSLICIVDPGSPGVTTTKVGSISGLTVSEETTPVHNKTIVKYNADTRGQKIIALTFDDGPSSPYTAEILKVLAEYDVKATFFMIGENVDRYPDEAKKVADAGHQVASHSYSHANMFKESDEVVRDDFVNAKRAIYEATGVETTVGRAPYGNFSAREWQVVGDALTVLVGWNIDSEDWRKGGPEVIANEIKNSARPGRIILCHDGGGKRDQTVAALKIALPELIAAGYSFVTIDELIALSAPPTAPEE